MKKFIKQMLSSSNAISSKRVFGAIGFTCSIIFIAMWKHDLIESLLYVSALMLGLETITKVFGAKFTK